MTLNIKRLSLVAALALTGLNMKCPQSELNFDGYNADKIVTDLTEQAKAGTLPAYARFTTTMLTYKPFVDLEKAVREQRTDNIVLLGQSSVDDVAVVQAVADALNDGTEKRHIYQIHLAELNKAAKADSFTRTDYFNFIEQKILHHLKNEAVYFIDDIGKYAYEGHRYKISADELIQKFLDHDRQIIYTVSKDAYKSHFKEYVQTKSPAKQPQPGQATILIEMQPYSVQQLYELLLAESKTYKVKIHEKDVLRLARLTRAFRPKAPPLELGLDALRAVESKAEAANTSSNKRMVLEVMSGVTDKPDTELEKSSAWSGLGPIYDSNLGIERELRTNPQFYVDEHDPKILRFQKMVDDSSEKAQRQAHRLAFGPDSWVPDLEETVQRLEEEVVRFETHLVTLGPKIDDADRTVHEFDRKIWVAGTKVQQMKGDFDEFKQSHPSTGLTSAQIAQFDSDKRRLEQLEAQMRGKGGSLPARMGQERSDLRNRIKAVKSKVAAERLDEEQGVALSNALSQADRELAALKQQREPSVMLRDKLRQQQWEFGNHVQDAKNLIKKTNGRIAYVESHKGTVTEIEGLRSDVRTIAGGVAVVKTELQKISEQFNPTVTDSLISTVISLRVKVGDITEQLDPDTAGGLRSTVDSLGIAVGTLQKEFDVNESGSLAKRVFEVAEEVKTFKGQLDHTQTGSLAHSMKELKTDYDGIKDQLDPSTAGSFAANVTKLTTDLGKVEKQLDPAKANSLAKIVKTLQANYNTLNSQFNSTEPGSFAESFVKLVLDVQVLSAKQPLGGLIAKLAALEPKIESLTTNKSDRQTDLAALKIGVQTEQDVVIVDQRGLTALMQRVTDLARNVEVLESKLH